MWLSTSPKLSLAEFNWTFISLTLSHVSGILNSYEGHQPVTAQPMHPGRVGGSRLVRRSWAAVQC